VQTALVVSGTSTTNNSTQFTTFSGTALMHLLTATCSVDFGFPGTSPVYGTANGGSSATCTSLSASLT